LLYISSGLRANQYKAKKPLYGNIDPEALTFVKKNANTMRQNPIKYIRNMLFIMNATYTVTFSSVIFTFNCINEYIANPTPSNACVNAAKLIFLVDIINLAFIGFISIKSKLPVRT